MPTDYATGFGHVTILTLDDDPSMRAAIGRCAGEPRRRRCGAPAARS